MRGFISVRWHSSPSPSFSRSHPTFHKKDHQRMTSILPATDTMDDSVSDRPEGWYFLCEDVRILILEQLAEDDEEHNDYPKYATVSKEWQEVFEQRTFRTLRIDSAERLMRLQHLEPRRTELVRVIELCVLAIGCGGRSMSGRLGAKNRRAWFTSFLDDA